jgi:hypothetical protein
MGAYSEVVFPATPGLQIGDWVRVTPVNRMTCFKPGEKGLIVRGPNRLGGEKPYYLVMMHKGESPCIVIFAEDEIEPDYRP